MFAESRYHNYSLIGDAKSFRLSRTAKNQKDFNVESMVHWRCDSDYSVLCCPYFQYPKKKSQIYGQALNGNVLLFSWEIFSLLIQEGIKETEEFSLAELWNFTNKLAQSITVQNQNVRFLDKINEYVMLLLNYTNENFERNLNFFRENIISRGNFEIEFWENKKKIIEQYSREEPIENLIRSLKLNEKVCSISNYINQLGS